MSASSDNYNRYFEFECKIKYRVKKSTTHHTNIMLPYQGTSSTVSKIEVHEGKVKRPTFHIFHVVSEF